MIRTSENQEPVQSFTQQYDTEVMHETFIYWLKDVYVYSLILHCFEPLKYINSAKLLITHAQKHAVQVLY